MKSTKKDNDQTTNQPYTIDSDKLDEKLEKDRNLQKQLEDRVKTPASGNPQATVVDPFTPNVIPRYTIVQNRSDKFLVIPDMKTTDEDMGLVFNPGEVVVLTDFYSPQQINRSKGLRHAATIMKGVGGNPMLVPLDSEEDAKEFKVPKKKTYAKGTTFEDHEPNDFDDRFYELEQREAKREEKLLRKTLGHRKTKKHGSAPAKV
jgi:hypothetical protein